MRIADSITQLIGNTPLVRLNRIGVGLPGQLITKLKSSNPVHAVKNRIVVAMIEARSTRRRARWFGREARSP